MIDLQNTGDIANNGIIQLIVFPLQALHRAGSWLTIKERTLYILVLKPNCGTWKRKLSNTSQT